jgi:nucleoside-diphosphate-sugar epimerase
MSRFTVLGAGGYVGQALVERLDQAGHVVHAITRAALPALLQARRPVGHVINCIGLTGDFRARPCDTADAHVGITARCLATLPCDSFLFLSSTRVYARAEATHEAAPLPSRPDDPSDLYNLTKLAGEALCLADPRRTVRVVRLSNVYGPALGTDSFLGQVLQEGRMTGRVLLRQAPESEKDYVGLDAVLRLLPRIATGGADRLYNLAAGHNTTHRTIAAALQATFGWDIGFQPDAPRVAFPPIDTARMDAEFGPALSNLSADLRILAPGAAEVPCLPSTRPTTG